MAETSARRPAARRPRAVARGVLRALVPRRPRDALLARLTGDYRRILWREHPQPFRGVPVEAYVLPPDVAAERPVLVFQHIQKTAGTALRGIIYRNLVAAGARVIVEDAPHGKRHAEAPDWYRRFYESLGEEDRLGLACVASHTANHLLPFIDRPARALSLLREPVDRVLSRYHHFTRSRSWTLRERYANAERRAPFQFFNAQSRALLAPHYDVNVPGLARHQGPPEDADLWRERLFELLAERYAIGLQEYFRESVELFAAELGWERVSVRRVRANPARPRSIDDEETAELIRAYNWLDVELHDRYLRRFRERFGDPTPS
jgi:Galactose-3-O-sulfotransferase